MQRGYYTALEPYLAEGKRIVLRTEPEAYFVDAVDVAIHLLKSRNVIMIIFDRTTRDLVDRISFEGGDVSRLRIIDAVSIVEGRGTPPIQHIVATYRPYDFNDLQVYSGLFAREFQYTDVVVLFVSIHRLEIYQNIDEIGIFMTTFRQQMKRYNIPEVILFHTASDPVFAQIIASGSDKIMPVHKQEIAIGGSE